MRDIEKKRACQRRYREKHREKIRKWNREYNKGYRQTHKAEIKAQIKVYREKNKDKIREQHKKYNAEYYSRPEIIQKVKAYKQTPAVKARKKIFDKRYYEANKEKIHTRQKIYDETHKEELKKYRKKYEQEHKEELKKYSKEYRDKNMQDFIATYKKGKCCEICGYKEYPEILQFHHKTDKSFTISTHKFMKPELLKAEIEKCILLCPNCHMWLHFKENKKI